VLEIIKNYLKITWDDEDSFVTDLIERGKKKLEELTGVELDFDSEGLARSLLLDYCRYTYNNASEYWEENFRHEILRLQLQVGVSQLVTDEVEINED